jgi:penicillin-binding protein 2
MRLRIGRRLLWLGVLFFFMLAALGGRLYQLQIVQGPRLARMAYTQRTLALPVASRRGMIYDRRGEPLTDPQSGWGVAAFPPLVTDAAGEAARLAPLLRMTPAEVEAKLRGREPSWVARVDQRLADRVAAMGLPGIAVGPAGERYGPDALAQHLVGYINQSGGMLGLERAFERELAGEGAQLVARLDGRGRPLGARPIEVALPDLGKLPYDLHTTLDARIQGAVEAVLDRHAVGQRAFRAAAVVLNPAGEVLALASRPAFDYRALDGLLKTPGRGSFLLNRAVSAYAPGSVFKAVVAAAALEAGKVSMEETFFCPGHYTIGGLTFHDADPGGHGRLTFAEAVARSCNVVFLQVAQRVGVSGLRAEAERFGFGQKTGALGRDWPEEQSGRVPPRGSEGAVQMAIGQGDLTATPLQVARAFAAIANGGLLPAVRLVTAVRSPEGEVIERIPRVQPARIMAPETARLLHRALLGVTAPNGRGTGRLAWTPVGVAGKTGSAEGVDSDGKRATHAWFAGYFPAEAPQYVMVVMVEGGGSGGAVAAPLFREVADVILRQP